MKDHRVSKLALEGGKPVRSTLLPYGKQWVDEEDIAAVVEVLRSDWLTTGPKVGELEQAFAAVTGAADAVAVTSGTAALHAAVHALNIHAGDEVVVPAMTFAASANSVLYQGGTPVFADVDSHTLLLDPASVEQRIGPRTRAIIAVDYAGQPCDYATIGNLARRHGLVVLADSCHALGASDRGRAVGTLATLSAFSLHPVKHITAGEGGIVTTNDSELAGRMRRFRNHGITSDHRRREVEGSWFYEMVELGFNYRLTDIQCALASSQLRKLPVWVARRQAIARRYDQAFGALSGVAPLRVRDGVSHAYHLYVVQLDFDVLRVDRAAIFTALRAEGIGVNVHYVPVHLHPYYRSRLNTKPGSCPVTEAAYERILSLPIFPRMTDHDVDDVIEAVTKVVRAYAA